MIKATSITALQTFFFMANTDSLVEPRGWGHRCSSRSSFRGQSQLLRLRVRSLQLSGVAFEEEVTITVNSAANCFLRFRSAR